MDGRFSRRRGSNGLLRLMAVVAWQWACQPGGDDTAAGVGREAAWPSPLEPVMATEGGEAFPALSSGGDTLFFSTHQAGWQGFDLVMSTWGESGWSEARPLPFSGGYNDRAPFPAPDGSRLFFASDRPVRGVEGLGGFNLWVVHRSAEGAWSEPAPVQGVNSAADDFHPAVAADGTLYFSSNRPGGEGSFDLWRARRHGEGYAEPENLGPVVNSSGEETDVYISPDGAFLLLVATERRGGLGGDDLWLTRREAGGWGPLENLGAPVNSSAYEYGPFISPDGGYLYFTTHRRGLGDLVRVPVASVPSLAVLMR